MNLAFLEKIFLGYLDKHPEILEKLVEALIHKFMGQFLADLNVP